jgi:hypothetical protein
MILFQICDVIFRRYLKHILGPNWRSDLLVDTTSCCCGRFDQIHHLINRNYGEIIFLNNGLFIDALLFFDYHQVQIISTELVIIDQQQPTLRLHIKKTVGHTMDLNAHQHPTGGLESSVRIDLFVPHSLQKPRERLDRMVELLNTNQQNVSNFNQLRLLFDPLLP